MVESTTGDFSSNGSSQLPLYRTEDPVEAEAAEEPSRRRNHRDLLTFLRSANKNSTNRSEAGPSS